MGWYCVCWSYCCVSLFPCRACHNGGYRGKSSTGVGTPQVSGHSGQLPVNEIVAYVLITYSLTTLLLSCTSHYTVPPIPPSPSTSLTLHTPSSLTIYTLSPFPSLVLYTPNPIPHPLCSLPPLPPSCYTLPHFPPPHSPVAEIMQEVPLLSCSPPHSAGSMGSASPQTPLSLSQEENGYDGDSEM